MAKFSSKRAQSKPKISTASLPDIIFMLLFFFMVVTVMRSAELKVDVRTPLATELENLEKKSLVSYIYVGRPKDAFQAEMGTSPIIQLNDKFSKLSDIPIFILQFREKTAERDRGLITSSLKVDRNVTMGIVQDIKTQLRKSGQLKVNYSAKPRGNK